MSKLLADPRVTFVSTLVLVLCFIGAGVVGLKIVEANARKQCLAQDWPTDKHSVHLQLCNYHGYPTSIR